MKSLLTFFLTLLTLITYAQHSLVLKSGDKINGVVLSLQNDMWTMYVEGQEKEIPMKEVASVFFNEYVPYDGVFIPDGEEKVMEVDGYTVKYNVKGRTMIEKPTISIGTEDKGAVVVKVEVDRYGHIRSAEPGASGSTTSSKYLYAKAQAAVKTAKFDENLKGPLSTEGTVTIIY
jgi:hypothetical protein